MRMHIIGWLLLCLFCNTAFAVGSAHPPLIDTGENLADFPEWRIDNYSTYNAVVYSPDGSTFASGGSDNTIRIWDTQTGDSLKTLQGHSGSVLSLAYSPDGNTLASAANDDTVRTWDVHTGENLKTLPGRSGMFPSVAYSPDGGTLAGTGPDNAIYVWDAQTGDILKTLQGHSGSVLSLVYSSDGSTLASGSLDRTIRIWDTQTGDTLKTLQGHSGSVLSLVYSPDGNTFASASDDGIVRIWDAQTSDTLKTLRGHREWVTSLAYSPDGSILVSASVDPTIRIWDVKTGDTLKVLQSHETTIWSVAYSPDGNTFASASDDRTVRIWDAHTGANLKTLHGYSSSVNAVTYSPDGNTIASAANDSTVHIWDAHTGKNLKTLQGHSSSVNAVAYSPDSSTLVSVGDDGTIRIWDTQTGENTKTLQDSSNFIKSVAYGPNGNTVASASSETREKTVRIWNVQTGDTLKNLQGHSSWINSVAYSPDGNTLASGSDDHTIRIWDTQTGDTLKTLKGHSAWVSFVVYSPDGKTLASAAGDKTIYIWDVGTGDTLKTLKGHSGTIRSLAYSPDGNTLVSTANDGTLYIWDVETGDIVKTLKDHGATTSSVAYNPNGSIIATSGSKGIAYWNKQEDLPVLQITYGPQGTWLRRDKEGNFWRYDNGSLLKIKRGNNWIAALPKSAVQINDNPLTFTLPAQPPILYSGKSTTIPITLKNSGEHLIYWVRPQLPRKLDSHFALKQSPDSNTLKPGESITLNLEVIPRLLKEIQPRDDELTIELASPQFDRPAQIKIPVKVNTPKLKLVTAELRKDSGILRTLKVRIANEGNQGISNTTFNLSVPGVEKIDPITVSEAIPKQGFLERTFTLPMGSQLEKDSKIDLTVSSHTLPLMAWNFQNQEVALLEPVWWVLVGLALLGMFGFAGAWYYRLYRHPLVVELSDTPTTLNTLSFSQLPQAQRLLKQTRRLSTVLDKAGVSAQSFQHAVDFPNQPPEQKAAALARRLGAQCETLNHEKALYRLTLSNDFPLNVRQLLLYFPASMDSPSPSGRGGRGVRGGAALAPEDVFSELKSLPESAGGNRITLIIGNDNSYQLKLLNTTTDTSNKYVAPRSSQLTAWLLSPDPETVLAQILAEQLSLNQISPYKIGGGVDNESVFFGRRELISQITNRDPANYLLVGGRQMGKSTLLKALQRRYADSPGVQCHYLSLSNEVLIPRLVHALKLEKTSDVEVLATQLETHAQNSGKRLLLLIDEADRFIEHEQANDYAILNVFRRLSEQGQCSFIFAGFWQLYRHAVLDYQSPLRNFGEVLEIGALEQDACYKLATEPMATMNLGYANDTIVTDMVAACGQRANLIAIACHYLVQTLTAGQREITAGDVHNVLNSQKMTERIAMGWALGNQPDEQRYERLIVYTTIGLEDFSSGELIGLLQTQGIEVDVALLEHCLARLQLAYVLKRDGKRWCYSVPLFVEYIQSDDPQVKLATLL